MNTFLSFRMSNIVSIGKPDICSNEHPLFVNHRMKADFGDT